MDKKIFLPSDEQSAQLMENAWEEFCVQAKEAGYDIGSSMVMKFIKDFFMAGYCYGHNDCLTIIRGQLEVIDMEAN